MSTSPDTPRTPRDHHIRTAELWSARADALAARSQRFSRTRLALAALVIVLAVLTGGYGTLPAATGWTLVALGVGLFVALVVAHDRLERHRRIAVAHVSVSREALARLDREWDALPVVARPPKAGDPHIASEVPARVSASASDTVARDDRDAASEEDATSLDLDLFGRASLRQLLGPAATPGGDARLTQWLLDALHGAAPDVAERQDAVRQLAPLTDHREALLAQARSSADLRSGAGAAFHAWVAVRGSVLARRWFALTALVVPVASVLVFLADRAGYRVAGGWVMIAAAAWLLRFLARRHVARAFAGSDALSGEIRRYVAMFDRWEQLPARSPAIASRQARLTSGGTTASRALGSLGRLVDLADLRWSHLPHVFVHSLTAWDVHVACALERWNVRHGAHVAEWFEALADLDALATLASLAHDEPAWTYPTIDAAAAALTARGLGHPLIASATRVGNDLSIGPPGTVLVITGSNMSGKSTLLRGTGLNITLAQLGAPVCADALSLPSVRLETSIRIADSLAQGVSYFMAALLRLKTIVEAADRAWHPGEARVLYLLDEVLQGTNSEERQVAIRHIVRHLAQSSAIGALTTHDLHLVEAPEFRAHAQHVHFTEHLEERPDGPVMTFDYQLRGGPAQSRNALALVRMVGLGDASLMTARPSPDYDAPPRSDTNHDEQT